MLRKITAFMLSICLIIGLTGWPLMRMLSYNYRSVLRIHFYFFIISYKLCYQKELFKSILRCVE
ncbi:hypothetical protein ACTPEM_23635, partial [Clostridioides difficile]